MPACPALATKTHAPVGCELTVFVALNQKVGSGHGIRPRIVVLPEDFDRGLLIVGTKPILRSCQQAAGATGGIANCNDDPCLSEHAAVWFEQQVDH